MREEDKAAKDEILNGYTDNPEGIMDMPDYEADYLKVSAQYERAKNHIQNQKAEIERLRAALLTVKLMVHHSSPIYVYINNILKRKDEATWQ